MDTESKSAENKTESLGCLPFAIGGASFIPLVGVFFGIISIAWGGIKWNVGGKKLVLVGTLGIGFTVMIYGTLGYFATNGDKLPFREINIEMAKFQMNEVVKSLEIYKLKHKEYPDSLKQLVSQGKEEILFLTESIKGLNKEQEFFYKKIDSGYYFFSKGFDGKPYTTDDIFPSIADSLGGLGFRRPKME